MTLSRRGDYVMRAAIFLARAHGDATPRKIREVVADTGVPTGFASQILADLVRAGLATSRAGRGGGYRLAREPEAITALEVVEAAEGPLHAERCAMGEGPCRWEAVCPLHETWSQATAGVRQLLQATTLAEVADRDAAIEAGQYPIPVDTHRARTVELADAVQVERSEARVRVALAGLADEAVAQLVAAAGAEVAGAEVAGAEVAGAEVAGAEVAGAGPSTPPAGPRGARRAPVDGTVDGAAPVEAMVVVEAGLAPVGDAAGRRGGAPPRYLLHWRWDTGARPTTFRAELTVGAVDPERCELRAEGTWVTSAAGPGTTAAGTDRHARAVLRGFLRRLARDLEAG